MSYTCTCDQNPATCPCASSRVVGLPSATHGGRGRQIFVMRPAYPNAQRVADGTFDHYAQSTTLTNAVWAWEAIADEAITAVVDCDSPEHAYALYVFDHVYGRDAHETVSIELTPEQARAHWQVHLWGAERRGGFWPLRFLSRDYWC